jgi:Na+/proline symporter
MILIPITVLLAWLCLRAVGGVDGFFSAIESRGLTDDFAFIKPPKEELNYNFTAPWVLASTIVLLCDRLSLNAAPRYFSCRDGRHASGAGWLVAGLMAASTLVFFLPPMVARILYSDAVAAASVPQPAEASYAVASMQLLPEALMGLMVVAIFSATLSTMDSGLNLFAAVFAKNIYPAYRRWRGQPPVEGAALVRVGESLTLLSGCAIIGIACYFAAAKGKGAFDLMLELGALLGLPMSTPLVLGLFTPRAPRRAAVWSMLSALVVSFVGYLSGRVDVLNDLIGTWTYDQKVFATLLTGVAGYFAAYVAKDSEEDRARTAEFYRRMRTPVDFEREVGSRPGQRSQGWILGWFSLATGAAVSLLAFPTAGWQWNGKLGVLAIAGFQMLVGAVLLWTGRRKTAGSS